MQKHLLFVLLLVVLLTETQIIPSIRPIKVIDPLIPIDNIILATQNA